MVGGWERNDLLMLGVGKKVISQGIEETKRRISRSKEKVKKSISMILLSNTEGMSQ